MARRELSREELFALVWERPTSEIANELGISDVAVGKLCEKLQVPKPPRGYWARVVAGQAPRRPALKAFREELDAKRKSALQARIAGHFTELQSKFLNAALEELRRRGIEHQVDTSRLKHISNLDQDIAAQTLLLIQGQAQKWAESGRVAVKWGTSVRASIGKLVERLMPLARPQLLAFETEGKRHSFSAAGPIVFVRWTAELQTRIATLARIARDQNLSHVVQPLSAADHAWSSTHLYQPESDFILNSYLCILHIVEMKLTEIHGCVDTAGRRCNKVRLTEVAECALFQNCLIVGAMPLRISFLNGPFELSERPLSQCILMIVITGRRFTSRHEIDDCVEIGGKTVHLGLILIRLPVPGAFPACGDMAQRPQRHAIEQIASGKEIANLVRRIRLHCLFHFALALTPSANPAAITF